VISNYLPSRGALAVTGRNLLVWRKLMRYSLVLNFGEPLIYLLGFGYGLGVFVGEMAGLPYLTFLATGIMVSSVMNTAVFEAMYSVYMRMDMQQTHTAMLVSPLRVPDVVAGEILWCALKGVIPGIAIMAVAIALGAVNHPWLLFVPFIALLTGLAFGSLGMLLPPFATGFDFFSYFYSLAVVPMLLICGVFFPLEAMPAAVQWVAQTLPLYHAIELVRPLATGQVPDGIAVHVGVLLVYAVGGYFLAVKFYRRRLLV